MQFMAHTEALNTGESQDFSHFARENGLKVLFISFVFIAVTYVITTILAKQQHAVSAATSHKKTKETPNE
jgi:hypothetical protein